MNADWLAGNTPRRARTNRYVQFIAGLKISIEGGREELRARSHALVRDGPRSLDAICQPSSPWPGPNLNILLFIDVTVAVLRGAFVYCYGIPALKEHL
ncbi:hypothetical protein Bpfe_004512 [Biomphalaria pfeifferi]|uniref:Uncharacterized protein n=1 Tax=Biomphalaria pfeifferi TaxID=112525 RepID=A0AAD8C4U3_BIOPF|nr:hypothetical protein Bpfe_004512 [Biomphalaria pfeifferi]